MSKDKNKKSHDQTVYDSHEGFREGTTKYHYFLEWKGTNIRSFKSNLQFDFEVGHFVNEPKGYFQIRRIQQNWVYGKFLTLVHMEKCDEQRV